jgi:hypothetical protein
VRKIIFIFVFFLVTLSIFGQTRGTLDEAIKNAALDIQNRLDSGARIVVYQFQPQNTRLSKYVLKEISRILVNSDKNYIVLDRTSSDVINAERRFQYVTNAGMISEESLMNLTRIIGAQAIITGSIDDIVSEYHFEIKAIGAETRRYLAWFTCSISKNDKKIKELLNKTEGEIGTGMLNIILGLGSFIEGDITGGLTITGGYAFATGLFATEALFLDWDSPIVGIPGTVGFCVVGLTFVYGFIRPFIYNYSPEFAVIIDNIHPKFVQVSDIYSNDPNYGLQVSYKLSF